MTTQYKGECFCGAVKIEVSGEPESMAADHQVTAALRAVLTMAFAATIPTLKFVPSLHVNYSASVLPMRDGLPKFRDFPKEFGGSGELAPE
jgi:hypothetical protein